MCLHYLYVNLVTSYMIPSFNSCCIVVCVVCAYLSFSQKKCFMFRFITARVKYTAIEFINIICYEDTLHFLWLDVDDRHHDINVYSCLEAPRRLLSQHGFGLRDFNAVLRTPCHLILDSILRDRASLYLYTRDELLGPSIKSKRKSVTIKID